MSAVLPEQGLAIDWIYRMNCLEGMPMLPDRSVDLILSDPPYGITENDWDSPVNLEDLWREYKRIIRPGGAILLTAQCPFDKLLGMSNRPWLRYEWIWEKSRATGFLHARRSPLRAHENVLVFYEHSPRYNPQFSEGRPYKTSRGHEFVRHLGRKIGAATTENTGYRYPRTVLHVPSEGTPIHPTQKPVALFEYLIRTYTNPGDLVLDTFMGSGTTAIACMNSSRHFVGFERDPEFFRDAVRRIKAHRAAPQPSQHS
ncbi:MAG TPA: site-specific DNA-methyltransferase [Verrucomicrobiae bacterium]|nr:site-specific DNA-methyltransferase [Verrucomicrobiae bacterium]